MKYKIKFEIDYSKMSKQEMRDSKIDELLSSDREMLEMEIDPLIKLPLPERGSIIDIDGKDYQIMDSKFKMESDCYTIVHLVDSVEAIKRRREEDKSAKVSGMLANAAVAKKKYSAFKTLK